jgi:phosphate transport system permease protein
MGADLHELARPVAALPPGPQRRIRPGAFGRHDAGVLGLCALSAFALTWLGFARISPVQSGAEFCIIWYLLFLATYWFVVHELEGPVMAGDRAMGVVVASAALAMIVPLGLILLYVLRKGLQGLTLHFFTRTQEFTGPLSSATSGGAAHAIVGTVEQVALAVLLSVPLGIMCAIFLNEIGGPLQRPVRVFVDAMSGVPTIVAGIFVYSVWVFEFGFSGFAAALAISVSMLPIVTRTSEEVLRLVPEGLREASLALGTSEWRTVWGVVLPTARSGLVTAVILAVARAIGETAPLIATAFGASVMNANPFQGPQAALPLFIFKQLTESAQPNVQVRAWTGCLVLMLLVLVLFTIARIVGSGALTRLSPRRAMRGRAG